MLPLLLPKCRSLVPMLSAVRQFVSLQSCVRISFEFEFELDDGLPYDLVLSIAIRTPDPDTPPIHKRVTLPFDTIVYSRARRMLFVSSSPTTKTSNPGGRQTLVTLNIEGGCLDGPAFLTLADCHNLREVYICETSLTSPEAAESITYLTQLQALDLGTYTGDYKAVLRLLPELQDLELGHRALQDSEAEALAGLSALTRLDFYGPIELARPHRLPKLKHLAFANDSIGPIQLDHLIGGSTSLRKIVLDWEGMEHPDSQRLDISAVLNDLHGISTAMRSVSLALQHCYIRQLVLFSDRHSLVGPGAGRVSLGPEVIEALVPLAETLRKLYLREIIVDEGVSRSIAQHLPHLRTPHNLDKQPRREVLAFVTSFELPHDASTKKTQASPCRVFQPTQGLLSDCVHTGDFTVYQAAACFLVDGLILDCSEGATGLDVERLFRACSPSSGNIRTLMISFVSKEIQSWMSSALHSLPMSLRQTLVTLEMTRCCLDGSAFLTLGDCHNLTALNINDTKLTSLEAAESITCLTQDSDVEALAGLSALTRLRFSGPIKLTRPNRLPKLKYLAFGDDITPLQLDRLIGGSTSLRQIVFNWEGMEYPYSLWLDISAVRNNLHGTSTAMRSVSLALQHRCIRQLVLFSDHCSFGGPGAGRVRLGPEVIEALVPLAKTMRKLYLREIILGKGVSKSMAQHLPHLRAVGVFRCTVVEGSSAALEEANIKLIENDDEVGYDEEESEED
eukprot:gene10070-7966_t